MPAVALLRHLSSYFDRLESDVDCGFTPHTLPIKSRPVARTPSTSPASPPPRCSKISRLTPRSAKRLAVSRSTLTRGLGVTLISSSSNRRRAALHAARSPSTHFAVASKSRANPYHPLARRAARL